MRSAPVAPVITGNITTRKRSTIPARSSERDRLTLPSVLRMPEPSSFIARTACTASPRTRVVLAHGRGSSSEAENTTFGARVSSSTLASSSDPSSIPGVSPPAKPYISRYVFAPIRYVTGGCSPSQARYSGPSRPHQPGQPSPDAYPSREVMKSIKSSRIVLLLERWIGHRTMLASERDWLPVSWSFLFSYPGFGDHYITEIALFPHPA